MLRCFRENSAVYPTLAFPLLFPVGDFLQVDSVARTRHSLHLRSLPSAQLFSERTLFGL